MARKRIRWCRESVEAEALIYSRVIDFKRGSRGAYDWAERNGCLKEITGLMNLEQKPLNYWTKERCMFIASYYEVLSEFIQKEWPCYRKCSALGILEEATSHMYRDNRLPKGHWDIKQNVIGEAVKYSTRADWQRGHSGSYNAASKNNWLDDPEVTGHMERVNGHDNDRAYGWLVTAANDEVVVPLPGYHLVKFGVTSQKLGDERPRNTMKANDMHGEIIAICDTATGEATNVEGVLLTLGVQPALPEDYDGKTEFRLISDSELNEARAILNG